MKTAFVFAGQGSQHVGMGADLYEAFEPFRSAFDAASEGTDVKKLCFDGPEDDARSSCRRQTSRSEGTAAQAPDESPGIPPYASYQSKRSQQPATSSPTATLP